MGAQERYPYNAEGSTAVLQAVSHSHRGNCSKESCKEAKSAESFVFCKQDGKPKSSLCVCKLLALHFPLLLSLFLDLKMKLIISSQRAMRAQERWEHIAEGSTAVLQAMSHSHRSLATPQKAARRPRLTLLGKSPGRSLLPSLWKTNSGVAAWQVTYSPWVTRVAGCLKHVHQEWHTQVGDLI